MRMPQLNIHCVI